MDGLKLWTAIKKGGYTPLSTKRKEIRLINLCDTVEHGLLRYDMHVVDIDHSPQYCALSYAWGAPVPEGNLKTVLINETIFKIRPTLFLFLSNMALHCPKKNMWIDTICINQTNTQERNHQVSLMGEIYRRAQEVYAWLGVGDDDTNYAIEHVKETEPQTTFVPEVFSMCVEKFFNTTYWTRRWIIQEFALAQSLIIVCGGHHIDWHQLATRIVGLAAKGNASALETLEAFQEVRSLSHIEGSLLNLMDRFRFARCSVVQDRAYALRSIASDGNRLVPNYSESIGDFYFRLLSILPTEQVLPKLRGYRWPHGDVARMRDLIEIKRQDILSSLTDHKDDRIYVVLEYIGRVEEVQQKLKAGEDEGDGFCNFSHEIRLDGIISENLLGNGDLLEGDLVYTLQSTPQSPEGFYIAFRPGLRAIRAVGMLIYKPKVRALAYWSERNICQDTITQMEKVVLHGVTACTRNLLAKSLKYRILCHISRHMLVLLWLLDLRQNIDLLNFQKTQANQCVSLGLQCSCLNDDQNDLGLLAKFPVANNYCLEILPSFQSPKKELSWTAAIGEPWWNPAPAKLSRSLYTDTATVLDKENIDFYNHGRNKISYAAGSGHIMFLEQLMSASEAVIDEKDDYGRTPLSWAAGNGHDRVVQLLLNTGRVDFEAADGEDKTPLWWAAKKGHFQAAKRLVKLRVNHDAAYTISSGFRAAPKLRVPNPLHVASETGHLHIVQLLIENGPDFSFEGGGFQFLQAASAGGHLEVVQYMLKQGADIKVVGYHALEAAAKNGHLHISRLLLEQGVDPNPKSGYESPLILAARNGYLEVVKLLLDNGASVYTLEQGPKALRVASICGHFEIVQLLLQREIGFNPVGAISYAIEAASHKGQLEIVQLLRSHTHVA